MGALTIDVTINQNRLPEMKAQGRALASRGVRAAVIRAWQYSIPHTPARTGELRRRVEITFRNGGLSGQARWAVRYAIFQELGTRRVIRPVRAKFLVFRGANGGLIFAKQVKGVTAKQFAKKGADQARPRFIADMRRAYQLGGR